MRANFLVDFFQTKIVDCTESVRIFLRKQFVKIINGRGGVHCTHEQVVGKGLFYQLYRTSKPHLSFLIIDRLIPYSLSKFKFLNKPDKLPIFGEKLYLEDDILQKSIDTCEKYNFP